jgi:hypothetical protein
VQITVVKKPKAYRLSDKTLYQIDWLKSQLGDITATDVITIAVAELYNRIKGEIPLVQLVKTEEGFFDVEVQGETLMRFNEEIIEHFPEDFREDLMAGRAPLEDVFVYLILSVTKGKGQVEYKSEELLQAYGVR